MAKGTTEEQLAYSIPEVAKILGIAECNAYELEKRPDFPSYRIGRRIIVPRHLFIRWMEQEVAKKMGETFDSQPLRVIK